MPSASARLGSRAHSPRLVNFGDVLGHQREAGAGAGREIGRTAARLLPPAMHSSRPRKSLEEVGGLLPSAARLRLEPGCTSTPSVGLRAAERAGLVVLDRLVGRLHDARGRHAETVVQRLLHRLHALVEHLEIDARDRSAPKRMLAARPGPAIGARSAGVLGQGIGGERAEADVVAADRQQHDVDRPLALLRRAPGLG